MKKMRINVQASRIQLFVLCIAVLATLILGMSTDSYAKKKKGAEDPGKSAAAIVDLNNADEKTLASLPGIGKTTAKAIIAGRPYKSLDDLKRVKGMSDKKISAIKDQVTFGAAAAPAAAPTAAETREKAASATKPAAEKAEKTSAKLAPGQHVNINTAGKEELEALPGIGPVKAQAIIDNRPYNAPEDIMKVKGIKQKSFEKIKDMITVR